MEHTFELDGEILVVTPAFVPGTWFQEQYPAAECLELSIQKWQAIVSLLEEGHIVHDGAERTCALCVRFCEDWDCVGCPVAERDDGGGDCEDTPYDDWVVATKAGRTTGVYSKLSALLAAQAELAFLEGLREVVRQEDS